MSAPIELFQAGKLKDAIAAATEMVKKNPSDAGARDILVTLLLYAGDHERADRQLEALTPSEPEPKQVMGHAQYRYLVRAERARQEFYTLGHPPALLGEVNERMKKVIEASILLREGRFEEARKLTEEALELFPVLKGTCNGKEFVGIRDMDDLLAGVFEVIAPNGKFYLVPMENVELIDFDTGEEGKRYLRDFLWREARLVVRDGPDGTVYFPTIYPGSHLVPEEPYALGQISDYRQKGEGGPYLGVGLREFKLSGKEDMSILDITELTIEKPA